MSLHDLLNNDVLYDIITAAMSVMMGQYLADHIRRMTGRMENPVWQFITRILLLVVMLAIVICTITGFMMVLVLCFGIPPRKNILTFSISIGLGLAIAMVIMKLATRLVKYVKGKIRKVK